MPFLLLLFLTLVCMPESWQEPVLFTTSPALSAALTTACMGVVVGMAALASRRVRSLAYGPGTRERASRRYGSWRLYHLVTLLGLYALSLYGLGWGWAVQRMLGGQPTLPAGGDLFVLAPFMLSLIFSWVFFYDAERALHDTGADAESLFWSRRAYVAFHARNNLALICVPLVLLIIQKGVRQLVPESVAETWKVESAVLSLVAPFAVLAALADPARLATVRILEAAGELSCTELLAESRLGCSKSTLSHHLRVLRRAGVTNTRVEGVRRYTTLRRDDLQYRFPGLLDAIVGAAFPAASGHWSAPGSGVVMAGPQVDP